MKKLLCIVALLLLLSGCGWLENEYYAEQPHQEPSTAPTEESSQPTPAAQDAQTLESLIMSFVRQGSAQNQIDVTGYGGDVGEDMAGVSKRLMANPICAYAVDYMDYDVQNVASGVLLEVNMVYRRSADEIANINHIDGMEQAEEELAQALREFDTVLTLHISRYRSMDFAEFVRRYSFEHPNEVVELPELSVAVYPEQGRSRVVELHFGYTDSKADMRNMLRTVSTLLQSAGSFAGSAKDPSQRLTLLCEYLIGRTKYEDASDQGAYELLCRQRANAPGFASVTYYTAKRAGINCYLVEGTRDDEPYWWNIVEIDGVHRHLDMMRQWQEGQREPVFYTDEEMTGYAWDTKNYPACPAPEQDPPPEESTEPPDSSEPDTSEPPESSNPTEPTSPSEPSELAESTSPPEPSGVDEPDEPSEYTQP